jgi:hypothetical protein
MKGKKMKRHNWKRLLFGSFLMLVLYLCMPTFQVLAQDNTSAQPDQTAEPTSSAEVDSYLAGMSDAQVRQAYAQKLKQDAEKRSASTQASEKGRPTNKVID